MESLKLFELFGMPNYFNLLKSREQIKQFLRKMRKMLHFYGMRKPFFILLSILLCLMSACGDGKTKIVKTAFYHWKTDFNLSDFEKDFIQKTKTEKLYVKFFDVDWNGKQAIPLASLNVKNIASVGQDIVPTVFITNRTFQYLEEEEIRSLANKVLTKIKRIFDNFPDIELYEIQFDCDWSESTRIAYFSFLEIINELVLEEKIELSTTIRLHQIKFFERTGVPPVKRGMLMFYNTGELRDYDTENSILDLKTAEKYLVNFDKYPIHLDLALPLFQWGVLFREEKMIRLLNGLSETDLKDTTLFQKTAAQRFSVKENTYLAGHFVYKKDKIRLEKITQTKLDNVVQILKPIWPKNDLTLTFYHIDSTVVQHFSTQKLLDLVNQLKKR